MSEVTYECTLCPAKHTVAKDSPLALLKLCKSCGEKRYRAGKLEQRKALASTGAAINTGEKHE
jgi:hypothetical protein